MLEIYTNNTGLVLPQVRRANMEKQRGLIHISVLGQPDRWQRRELAPGTAEELIVPHFIGRGKFRVAVEEESAKLYVMPDYGTLGITDEFGDAQKHWPQLREVGIKQIVRGQHPEINIRLPQVTKMTRILNYHNPYRIIADVDENGVSGKVFALLRFFQ